MPARIYDGVHLTAADDVRLEFDQSIDPDFGGLGIANKAIC